MAKMNLKVFKRGKPIYWIVGGVFLFIVFYLIFNSGGSSASSGSRVIQTGPSEALQIAGLQAGASANQAQIAANVQAQKIQADRETAAFGMQVALANIASGEIATLAQLDQQRYIAGLNADTNYRINQDNLEFAAHNAALNSQTQLGLRALDIGLLETQMQTQADMFRVQSNNLIQQNLIGQVSSLKKKDRDETLQILAGMNSDTPFAFDNGPGPANIYGYIPGGYTRA